MPFDSNTSLDAEQFRDMPDPEVERFRAEIRLAMKSPATRARLAKDFEWQIKAQPGRKLGYRLRPSGNGGGGDDWFYLSNIVMQGGGTLGLAHAGLIAALEEANIRFAGIAGTSAGSIIAMGLVAVRGDDLTRPAAGAIDDLVRNVPMETFIDGPRRARLAIKHGLLERSFLSLRQLPNVIFCIRRVLRLYGLNPGTAFEEWLQDTLAQHGLADLDSLNRRLERQSDALRGAQCAEDNPFVGSLSEDQGGCELLRIVATAMPVGRKFSFPEFTKYLNMEGQSVSPAALVRMSMSIPLFFEPRTMPVKRHGSGRTSPWEDYVNKHISALATETEVNEAHDLEELYFLDGGLFSNLPVAELPAVQGVPTLTVPLISSRFVSKRKRRGGVSAFIGHAASVMNAVRGLHDSEGIQRTQPKMLKIDTGDANWLNFLMEEDEKSDLYRAGFKRGRDLIVGGVWDELAK